MPLSEVVRERRRSPRVCRVLEIEGNTGDQGVALRTFVISAHGALVLSSEPFIMGTDLSLRNPATGAQAKAWVVMVGSAEVEGRFVLGLEFLSGADGFWGRELRP